MDNVDIGKDTANFNLLFGFTVMILYVKRKSIPPFHDTLCFIRKKKKKEC